MKWTEGNEGKYSIGDYVVEYGTGDHNFCRYHKYTPYVPLSQFRAPNHTNPWCYLESGNWEDCAIPLCVEQSPSSALTTTSSPVEDCLTTIQGFDYRGSQSKTVSGMLGFKSSCKHITLFGPFLWHWWIFQSLVLPRCNLCELDCKRKIPHG